MSPRTEPSPSFVYLDARGVRHEAISKTYDPKLGSLTAGDLVAVEYAGEYARIRGTRASSFGLWAVWVLLFPFVGVAMAIAALVGRQRRVRAYRHGTPALAIVIYVGPDRSTTVNGRHPQSLRWEFVVGGAMYRGSFSSFDETEIALLNKPKIVVLFEPKRPATNCVWFDDSVS